MVIVINLTPIPILVVIVLFAVNVVAIYTYRNIYLFICLFIWEQ